MRVLRRHILPTKWPPLPHFFLFFFCPLLQPKKYLHIHLNKTPTSRAATNGQSKRQTKRDRERKREMMREKNHGKKKRRNICERKQQHEPGSGSGSGSGCVVWSRQRGRLMTTVTVNRRRQGVTARGVAASHLQCSAAISLQRCGILAAEKKKGKSK